MFGLGKSAIITFQITMSELISVITNSLTLTTLLAYIFILWATIVIWTWFDISSRTENWIFRFGSIIIVATGFVFGLAIYLILRPDMTKEETSMKNIEDSIFVSQTKVLLCPNCYSVVKEDFAFCSNCAFKLQTTCKNCDKKINVAWFICPFCGFKNDNMIKAKNLSEIPQAAEKEARALPKRRVLIGRVVSFLLNPNEKTKSPESEKVTKPLVSKTEVAKTKRQAKRKKA